MRWRFSKLKGQWLPGAISGALIALLWMCNALQPLEDLGYNLLFQLRGAQAWNERVVVIKIDDKSIQAAGQFPWNRKYYTQLLTVLSKTDVSAIAFDILMSEPTSEDQKLANAMLQQGKVVLAQALNRDQVGIQLKPVPILRNAAVGNAIGHIQKGVDADGIVRKVRTQVSIESEQVPVLAIAAVEVDRFLHDIPPTPKQPFLWLNWSGKNNRVQSYSFLDVIESRVPVDTFRDKIILVGVTATGFDPLITPFDQEPPTSGIYLQATLVNNILQQNLLKPFPRAWNESSERPWEPFWIVSFLILGGLLWSWILRGFRTPRQVTISILFCIGWIILSRVVLVNAIWIPSITPLLLITTTLVAVILYERLSLNALLYQQVQQLWNAYYEDLVVSQDRNAQPIMQRFSQQPISMQRVTQLATLAEQFGRSHAAQAAIARSLTLGLLAADLEGTVWFCNPIATRWLNTQVGDILCPKLVPSWLADEEWTTILKTLDQTSPLEVRQAERWFELTFEPLFYHRTDQMPRGLLLVLEDITERKEAAIALQNYANTQAELNQRLSDRTTELELVNQELEAFSYAVSHDLRAPLRRIKGFSQLLVEDHAEQLDQEGKTYLNRIDASVQKMGELIENLLNLSRVVRYSMSLESVNISEVIREITQELHQSQPERQSQFIIQPDLLIHADRELLHIALENLLGNAWKYTSKKQITQIEFGVMPREALDSSESESDSIETPQSSYRVFFIRDNGAGFDMTHAKRLFSAFQRLHTAEEFPGTGIGLMTTRRIIHRHHGRIWAEGAVDQGATFYFTLPSGSLGTLSLIR